MKPTVKHLAIENYLQSHVLARPIIQEKPWRIWLKIILALFGAAWGLPWIHAAMSAVAFFPSTYASFLSILFAITIVMAVGADGLWIMLETNKALNKLSSAEQALLREHKENRFYFFKRMIPLLFAAFSCVAPVYAAIKFSVGLDKTLAIITLVGYYGYGFIGYTKLVDRVMLKWRDSKGDKNLIKTRDYLLQGIHNFMYGDFKLSMKTSAKQWLSKWVAYAEINNKGTLSQPLVKLKLIFQLLFVLLIPPASCLVSVLLIRKFLQNNIWDNNTFSLIVAILAEIPGLVICAIATYDIFGKFFDMLFGRSQPMAIKKLWPKASKLLPYAFAAIALTAPSAAAYITYTTLNEWHMGWFWLWSSVIAISIARLVFSYFTLQQLTNRFAIWLYHSGWLKSLRPSQTAWATQHMRLQKAMEILRRASLQHFNLN